MAIYVMYAQDTKDCVKKANLLEGQGATVISIIANERRLSHAIWYRASFDDEQLDRIDEEVARIREEPCE
jgi:hypothetical protein